MCNPLIGFSCIFNCALCMYFRGVLFALYWFCMMLLCCLYGKTTMYVCIFQCRNLPSTVVIISLSVLVCYVCSESLSWLDCVSVLQPVPLYFLRHPTRPLQSTQALERRLHVEWWVEPRQWLRLPWCRAPFRRCFLCQWCRTRRPWLRPLRPRPIRRPWLPTPWHTSRGSHQSHWSRCRGTSCCSARCCSLPLSSWTQANSSHRYIHHWPLNCLKL